MIPLWENGKLCFSEPDTDPNRVGSLGSDRYKDTIPLWENNKLCISEPDTDPNWVGSFGLDTCDDTSQPWLVGWEGGAGEAASLKS